MKRDKGENMENSAPHANAVSVSEIAPLQNGIIGELRTIYGSEKIPNDINIQENGDKFEMIEKLSSLLDKLKIIRSSLSRY